MSVLFFSGFDHLDTAGLALAGWSVSSTTAITVASAAARTGTNGVQISTSSSGQDMKRQVDVSEEHATFVVGLAVYRPSANSLGVINFMSDNAGTFHLSFRITTDGSLDVRRGANSVAAGGTIISAASVANAVPVGVWTHLGFRVVLSDTVGEIGIWVNGQQQIALTSQDTKNGGTKTAFDTIDIYGASVFYIDDLYILNGAGSSPWNAFLGDRRVVALTPNGAGGLTQLTSSSGSTNYQNVDETPANTTDYNSGATTGLTDTYTYTDLAASVTSVSAVQFVPYARKTDVDTLYLKAVARLSGTNHTGSSRALSTGYTYLKSTIWQTNPATSAAWTPSEVNAAEFGPQVSTT